VVVEEKLDGKRIRFPCDGYILFKEDCKKCHTINYMRLPAWEIGFDIWNGERFLNREEKEEIFGILSIPVAPVLLQGEFASLEPILALLGTPSEFGAEKIEGVVIKNYEKQLFGKIVDPLFDAEIDEKGHHLGHPYVSNRLDLMKMYVEG
jgi:hypothetical protein